MGYKPQILCAALFLSAAAGVQAKAVSRKQLPPAVVTAFEKAYPKAALNGADERKKGGQTLYEIKTLEGTSTLKLRYQADGTLLESEGPVATADLPAPVQDAVKARYPKDPVSQAEKTTRGGATTYKVMVKTAKGKATLHLDASGKVVTETKA